ncbi:MAG: 50S ribosomal protein L22, partial [Elusimicrobiota bacterium]
ARRTAKLLRNRSVNQALSILFGLRNKSKAASFIEKTLKSAVANINNTERTMEPGEFFIKRITIDGGPMAKRIRPRAQGRANRILKRTSHITIVIADQN